MFYVYVIKLKQEFGGTRKAIEANPERDPDLPCIYVGYSSKPPEERFEEHIKGKRSDKGHPLFSRIVKRWGVALMPEMYESYNPIKSMDKAKKMEQTLAEKYRKEGFTVWWN